MNNIVSELPDPLNPFALDDVPDSLLTAATEAPFIHSEIGFEGSEHFRVHEGLLFYQANIAGCQYDGCLYELITLTPRISE